MLLGNYNGTPSHPVTILARHQELAGTNIEVGRTNPVVRWRLQKRRAESPAAESRANALATAAKRRIVVIYVGGISPQLEGEEMRRALMTASTAATARRSNCPPCRRFAPGAAGDRQTDGVRELQRQRDGDAVGGGKSARRFCRRGIRASKADAPWRRFCSATKIPPGRLPVTFYRATADLPAFDRLLDEQPHLPLLQRQAAVRVRPWLELHPLQVSERRDRTTRCAVGRRDSPHRASGQYRHARRR